MQQRGPEQGSLHDWCRIRNQNDKARMQIHPAEQPKEVGAIVGDEGKFAFHHRFSELPIRLAVQSQEVDVGSFESMRMSQFDE